MSRCIYQAGLSVHEMPAHNAVQHHLEETYVQYRAYNIDNYDDECNYVFYFQWKAVLTC